MSDSFCTGCGRSSNSPVTGKALACCPDNRYRTINEIIDERQGFSVELELARTRINDLIGLLEFLGERLTSPHFSQDAAKHTIDVALGSEGGSNG